MRPIRLRMNTFGPYAKEQVIDFRELQHRTLFLIHGETGAGKTTILDAICFALYGKTSGGERQDKQMRSHHAPATQKSEVQFDFEIAGRCYRVVRSMEYDRIGRGGRPVKEEAAAVLWERTGLGDDDGDGILLEEQNKKVDKQLVEILGFEVQQFQQVVILPQGKFRDFLSASSGVREGILKSSSKPNCTNVLPPN